MLLASVPALLCRLGRVSYNRAFGALMCCIQSRLWHSLITRVTKSVAINQKNSVCWIRTQDKKFMNYVIKNMQ